MAERQNASSQCESPMRKLFLLLSIIMVIRHTVGGMPAEASPSLLCRDSAQYASEKTGVPLPILLALTLAETGQSTFNKGNFSAWPWAVQSGNEGKWFPDSQSAISFVHGLMAQGRSNIDVGCFQLNIYWHGKAFQSIEEMIAPNKNALYAARFLLRLYQQTGDWRTAVGRYHSNNAERAEGYIQRLKKLYSTHLSPDHFVATSALSPDKRNRALVPQKFGLVSARGPLLLRPSITNPLIGGSR